MSRPGYCWRCGIDPVEWWMKVDERVWCNRCLDIALSLFAALLNVNALPNVLELLRTMDEGHLANEIARALAPGGKR